jgi:hypothetical protein
VIVRYKLIDKTIDFNLVGGLSSNLLVNNSVYASIEGERYQVGRTEGMSMLTFSSSLGMGMEYNFSGNLSLNLEPTFRYYINPFSQTPILKIHPYSFGIFSANLTDSDLKFLFKVLSLSMIYILLSRKIVPSFVFYTGILMARKKLLYLQQYDNCVDPCHLSLIPRAS